MSLTQNKLPDLDNVHDPGPVAHLCIEGRTHALCGILWTDAMINHCRSGKDHRHCGGCEQEVRALMKKYEHTYAEWACGRRVEP